MITILLSVLTVLCVVGLIGAYAWIISLDQDLDAFRDEMYERYPEEWDS